VDRLRNQVPSLIQTLFPNNDADFQEDNALIHTDESVQLWCEERKGEHEHFLWPAQSPDLNITEQLWSVLEPSVRNRFPLPTSLKQLGHVLQEEWYNIPLQTVQNLCESIPSSIAAVLESKCDPTPY
jgi:hypothetical protein